MGKYHYSYYIMAMLLGRVVLLIDGKHRLNKIFALETLKAHTERQLSRPLVELVNYSLTQLAKIFRKKAMKKYTIGFIAIAEKSRLEASALKLVARK
jgi:hypothetical protein